MSKRKPSKHRSIAAGRLGIAEQAKLLAENADDRKMAAWRLPRRTIARVKALAAVIDRDQAVIVTEALDAYLDASTGKLDANLAGTVATLAKRYESAS